MSQIREINIDNVVEFLNSNDYTLDYLSNGFYFKGINYGFKLRDYISFMNNFVDYFFNEKNEIEIEPPDKYMGSPIFINENKSQKILKNLNKLSFYKMYPVIISELYKLGKVDFSILEMGGIYSFVIENFLNIRNHIKMKDESKILLKYFLNYLYSASNNAFRPFGINRVDKVIDYYRNAYEELSKLPGVIYIDVDTIYFEESITDKVQEIVDDLNIPYDIENDIKSYFIQKKKYVSLEDNGIKIRGINPDRIKPTGVYKEFHKIVNKFQMELRQNKINKIKESCVKEPI